MDHGGKRPYPCPECTFTCKTKQQLNEHRRKHSVSLDNCWNWLMLLGVTGFLNVNIVFLLDLLLLVFAGKFSVDSSFCFH